MPAKTERQRRRSDAYWAGFFDGEGSVWLAVYQRKGCSRPQVSLKVSVSNTHRGIVDDLAYDFPPPRGRAVASFLGGPKDQAKRRQQYKWEMSGVSARDFLQVVYPHLVIRKAQVELAFEFYGLPWRTQRSSPGGGWKIRTDEAVAVDLDMARQMKELKYAS